jgi:hypothetical protein
MSKAPPRTGLMSGNTSSPDPPAHLATRALVAASLAGGIIAVSAPMLADAAVRVFEDVLAALSRGVETERSEP